MRTSGQTVAILFVMYLSRITTIHRETWPQRACNPEHTPEVVSANTLWHRQFFREGARRFRLVTACERVHWVLDSTYSKGHVLLLAQQLS